MTLPPWIFPFTSVAPTRVMVPIFESLMVAVPVVVPVVGVKSVVVKCLLGSPP
ncbi:MAG: hypothetical protein QM533_12185 [Cytophagales bacterium]|nr:hypothetical protein [Cytophagales bacterium]